MPQAKTGFSWPSGQTAKAQCIACFELQLVFNECDRPTQHLGSFISGSTLYIMKSEIIPLREYKPVPYDKKKQKF